MAVSIYLSNNTVQIAIGAASKSKVRVERIYSLTIPEGSLLNGVITSEPNLKNDLRQIWEQYQIPKKNVRLVLDSSRIMVKALSVPRAGLKKMMSSVAQGFSDTMQTAEGYLFDGSTQREQQSGKQEEILATAAEQEYIGDYVRLFEDIGVTLESVDVSVNAQMKVINRIPELGAETVITSHLDGNNLVSTLVIGGRYKYFNRTRLFSGHGTEDFAAEVARTVSSIMQFYSSQKLEEPLETVYMGGYGAQDFEVCRTAIERLGIRAEIPENADGFVLPNEEQAIVQSDLNGEPIRTCDYIYPIGALIQKKQDINLYQKYMKEKKAGDHTFSVKKAIPVLIALGVCVAASAVLIGMNLFTRREVNAAESYIGDAANKKAYAEALEKQAEAVRMQGSVTEGQQIWDTIHSYPLPDSKVEQEIVQCAGSDVSITIDSYDAGTGVYGFTAKAADVTTINAFIDRLRGSSVFANLEYSGYAMEEDTGAYLIMVDGFLNESAGR